MFSASLVSLQSQYLGFQLVSFSVFPFGDRTSVIFVFVRLDIPFLLFSSFFEIGQGFPRPLSPCNLNIWGSSYSLLFL